MTTEFIEKARDLLYGDGPFVARRTLDKTAYEVIEQTNADWREVISDDQKHHAYFETHAEACQHRDSLHVEWAFNQLGLSEAATPVAAVPPSGAVHVCPARDIVCGDAPANWCAACPKRGAVAAVPGDVLMKIAAIAAECSDPDTTDALDALISSMPASPTPPATVAVAAVPDIDYEALINAAFARHKWAQGTRGCSAFARGAEWFREQVIAAAQVEGAQP